MYDIIKFCENVVKFIRIKTKIMYWKIKYGKNIKIGKGFTFRKGLIINMTKDAYLEIGDYNGFNNFCSINCHKKIIIGSNNIFGEGVKIYDHNHIFNDKTIDFKRNFKTREIDIGNNNWIASNVTILSKTKLEDRNVVGANVVLNAKYGSDNMITNNGNIVETKKIIYGRSKDGKN